MKTKFLAVALLASAALVCQAQAGGHTGGGGGGHFASANSGRGGAGSFRGGSARLGGGRMIYSGRRFSPVAATQFAPGSITGDRTFTGRSNIAQRQNRARLSSGAISNHGSGSGRTLPGNWRNHVVAQHSANWHREWSRGRDHSWRGHHCRFVNGSWVVFDLGFYPWWPYYDYYPYPYGYDSDYYGSDGYQRDSYDDQNVYEPADENADSAVAAAQERLAQQGYYRGDIDGVFGPATRRAIARYQGKHGLGVSGRLTPDTLTALRLQRVASD